MAILPLIEQTHKYVAFRINQELFGVHIEAIQQIIPVLSITFVPRTPSYFLGILNLRGETIAVLDLRALFQQPRLKPDSEQRIVIVDFGNSRLGMVVDLVEGIFNVPLGEVRSPPPLLDPQVIEYLIGSYQLNKEQTLLLLDQECLIDPKEFRSSDLDIRQEGNSRNVEALSPSEGEDILLGFELGNEQFALNIDVVEEIIQPPTITHIPQVPSGIEGVFTLRNEVIPLVHLGRRLGLLEDETSLDTNVLVVNLAGVKLGIIVGKIQEVRRLPHSRIEPVPQNVAREEAQHLRGIIQNKFENTLILQSVITLEHLFSDEELARLSEYVQRELLIQVIEESDEEILYLLRFKIAGEPYAVRVYQINQIINLYPIYSVPKTPPHVLGVINVRGEIITVLDLPRLLNSHFPLDKNLAKIIIVNMKNKKVGFLVDEVLGAMNVSNKIFEFPGNWGQEEKYPLVEAIGREEEGQMTVLLDIYAAFRRALQYSVEEIHSPHQSTSH